MKKVNNETTLEGIEIVTWTNDDGSGGSMTKEAYEALQVEHLTEIIPADEA